MSRGFSSKSGSVDSLNVSERCGAKPKARQIRNLMVWLMPTRLAMSRVAQCRALGSRVQREADQALDLLAINLAGRPAALRVVQTLHPVSRETSPPRGYGQTADAEGACHAHVGRPRF